MREHDIGPVALRAYRAEDAAALGQLYFESVRALGPRRYTAQQVEAWAPAPPDADRVHARAADGRCTLVACGAGGEIFGYADLEADGHIDHLYCSPRGAGAGVAELLLDALIERARAAGLAMLHVQASELARSLFARRGFEVSARRDFEIRGVPIHNYAMVKRVGPAR